MHIDEPENEREALEDKVYDLYPQLDMTEIQRMTDEQLNTMVQRANGKTQGNLSKPGKATISLKVPKPKWIKINEGYDVRNGQLVHVEKWRMGLTEREKIKPCGNRVTYEGEQMSAAILKHYLMTGEWVKRVPKPKKAKAILSVNGKTIYLGSFATLEERDAAIFQYKLGIFTKKT